MLLQPPQTVTHADSATMANAWNKTEGWCGFIVSFGRIRLFRHGHSRKGAGRGRLNGSRRWQTVAFKSIGRKAAGAATAVTLPVRSHGGLAKPIHTLFLRNPPIFSDRFTSRRRCSDAFMHSLAHS